MSSASVSSSDALDGFVVLSRSSSGLQCVMLIKQVLKHPSIYVFGELLDQANIKALAGTEHQSWLDALQLFAYGTYADYKQKMAASPSSLPDLSAFEISKLKLLSLVSLCSGEKKHISYEKLLKELELSNVRELEDMIIEAIYAGLVDGKLDQKKQEFAVAFAMGRDIGPSDVDAMISNISVWLNSSDAIVRSLDEKIQLARDTQEFHLKEEADMAVQRKDVMEAIKLQQKESGGTGTGTGSSDMDDSRMRSGRRKHGLKMFR